MTGGKTQQTAPSSCIGAYKAPTVEQRAAAATPSGHVKVPTKFIEATELFFPAPLVLPNDDLALGPRFPPQSLRAWLRDKDRNKVTPGRSVIYIAAPPHVSPEVAFINSWSCPTIGGVAAKDTDVKPPHVRDVLGYLKAFYHGLPVRLLPSSALRFAAWDDDGALEAESSGRYGEARGASRVKGKGKKRKRASVSEYIALNTPSESIRIRTRHRPSPALFPQQLNLEDVLDAAMAILPDDGYALLLLIEQDLFEDVEDDFVCGRAYGGSRIAVVSMARYAPTLDAEQGVEREHAWPGSHCEAYLRERCGDVRKESGVGRGGLRETADPAVVNGKGHLISPLRAALNAHLSLPAFSSPAALSGLWLGRVCKTASHELGHCFGIDHCVYYACIMQGSASLGEDARQPPYLCPVDEAKLARALVEWSEAAVEERKGAPSRMREFCTEMGKETHLWRALGAWLGGVEGMAV